MLVKHSRPFKKYPFNVISLSKSFSEQLVKEKVYLVIEAYFDFRLKPTCNLFYGQTDGVCKACNHGYRCLRRKIQYDCKKISRNGKSKA